MTSWRLRIRVWPWLLAPALVVAACGHTDSSDDKPSSAGKGGTVGGGHPTSGGASSTGGTGPTAGMTGRGGTQMITEAGAGGAAPIPVMIPGISETPQTRSCGAEMCQSAAVGPLFVDPCCAGDGCGLDTAGLALLGVPFSERCQALAQPGDVDTSCPTSAGSTVPVPLGGQTIMLPINGFVGCCREDGKCGVVANAIVSPLLGPVATLGLGCVDSAPFFGNQPAASCGAGSGGASSGGAAGASSDFGGASAGGEAGASTSVGGAG